MKNNFKFQKDDSLCADNFLSVDIYYRNAHVDYFGIDVFGNVSGLEVSTEFILEDVFEVEKISEIPGIKKLHNDFFKKDEVTK